VVRAHSGLGVSHVVCDQLRKKRSDPRRASLASEAISTVPPMGFEPMLERV
jgi:hypothetical protein